MCYINNLRKNILKIKKSGRGAWKDNLAPTTTLLSGPWTVHQQARVPPPQRHFTTPVPLLAMQTLFSPAARSGTAPPPPNPRLFFSLKNTPPYQLRLSGASIPSSAQFSLSSSFCLTPLKIHQLLHPPQCTLNRRVFKTLSSVSTAYPSGNDDSEKAKLAQVSASARHLELKPSNTFEFIYCVCELVPNFALWNICPIPRGSWMRLNHERAFWHIILSFGFRVIS